MNLKPTAKACVLHASDQGTGEPGTAETWPPVEEWVRRERALAARRFRRLGVRPEPMDQGVLSSQVLNVLGPDSFAEFPAVRTGGKIIWCNFELARQLGFKVPRSNQLTREFHEQLLGALSFRALRPEEDAGGQNTIVMYADKYGGDGLGPALGAGRAGFLPYGNLYVKGIGFTPLFRHNDVNDFAHSHGAVHLDDCLSEAVFGEVNENLFTQGTTRVLAIIDHGRDVIPPSCRRIPVALVVRTGAQLRPAHLLIRLRSKQFLLDKFLRMTVASRQLVTRQEATSGKEFPDLRATMLRIIDDHACTAAEAFRWRMIHGALSASNMDISGAMLDLPTQSTQPRTAPVWCLDYTGSVFGVEHTERAVHLIPIYRKLMRNIPVSEWPQFNLGLLDIRSEMAKAYRNHLEVKLLSAAGLKTVVAIRIQRERRELATSFTNTILKMASLKNRGPVCISKDSVEQISTLDVFNLLRRLPEAYFANPDGDHTATVLRYLKPIFKGNRFHIAKKKSVVDALVSEFAKLFPDLMKACAVFAPTYYGNLKRMEAAITARAAFENEPLDFLYARRLYADLREAITAYRSTGDPEILRAVIDLRIAASLRSVDGLLAQGNSRRLTDGGVELEMRSLRGINYSVRAWNDGPKTGCLHVSIPLDPHGQYYLSAVPGLGRLTRQKIEALRYHFTTNGWRTSQEARARLRFEEGDAPVIDFDELNVCSSVGRLEGAFYTRPNGHRASRVQPPRFGGYVFAIPDKYDLEGMLRRDETNHS